MRHRITVNIRRKGEGFMAGTELKEEHYDSIEELIQSVAEFINDEIKQDEYESEEA